MEGDGTHPVSMAGQGAIDELQTFVGAQKTKFGFGPPSTISVPAF